MKKIKLFENYINSINKVNIDGVDYSIIDYGLIKLAGYDEENDDIVIEKDTLFYYCNNKIGSKIPSVYDLEILHKQKKLPYINYKNVNSNEPFFKRYGFFSHLLKRQICTYWTSDNVSKYSGTFYKTYIIDENSFDIDPNDGVIKTISHANCDCEIHGFLLVRLT